jgi:hypothetical protein
VLFGQALSDYSSSQEFPLSDDSTGFPLP